MAENVSVSPTPIQRNALDVAVELLNMHVERKAINVEDISKLFAEYYVLVNTLQRKNPGDLKEFLPEDIKNNIYKGY